MNKNSDFCGCLYFSTKALGRILNSFAEKEFRQVGLSPSYAFLIMAVANKPGVHPKELANELELKPSTVTRLLEKLEAGDLIHREPIGKITEVHLTAKGLTQLESIKKCWYNLYLAYTNVLGEEAGKKIAHQINETALKLEKQ